MDVEIKKSIKPIKYNFAINYMEKRLEQISKGKKNELMWILEHNTVYTGGTSSNNKDLIDKNLNIIKTKRGGKYTVHSPGQKIVYFVLNLNKRKKDIRKLINQIEIIIINILKNYKVTSNADKKNIGIWVDDKKIAAIGLRVRKWIAYHGFSLNVSNDLTIYDGIIPCGIKNKDVTSLKNLGINNYSEIDKIISKEFLKIFF